MFWPVVRGVEVVGSDVVDLVVREEVEEVFRSRRVISGSWDDGRGRESRSVASVKPAGPPPTMRIDFGTEHDIFVWLSRSKS